MQGSRVPTYDVRCIVVVWLSLMRGVQASVGVCWVMIQILQQESELRLQATFIVARTVLHLKTSHNGAGLDQMGQVKAKLQ